MTAIYLFAAAAGVPLAIWFLFGGSDEGGDAGGDADGGDGSGADDGIGAIMGRLLPLSTVVLAVAMFGLTGLALGVADTDAGFTFVAALGVGLITGALNSSLFGYLRRSDSTAAVSDAQVTGAVGRVVLPVAPGRRGRIAVAVGEQQLYFSATYLADDPPTELAVGDPILVVEMHNGVASVTRLDPELT